MTNQVLQGKAVYDALVEKYLTSKGSTLDTASPALVSDAQASATCYLWYLSEMRVSPENAVMATDVWLRKYALHDGDGICLEMTPEDTWRREARALAEEEVRSNPKGKDVDYWTEQFYTALDGWKYSPQGSGMYALGNSYVRASVSNCFVAPSPEDSLESIFDTARYLARTYASRGGCGINLNKLRPFGATTNNAAKTSTGAVSFMDFYSYVTGMIGQAGRRGALMECMTVHHPDIERFIDNKTDEKLQPFFNELAEAGVNINDWKWNSVAERLKSTSFANVSVMVTDEFMDAVKRGTDYEQRFIFEGEAAKKYNPIMKLVSAESVWQKLMNAAWKSAEPGILFWDHITKESVSDYYGVIPEFTFDDPATGQPATVYNLDVRVSATNPCGEQPLSADDSCSLGTHYLPAFVKNPWTRQAEFDFDEYARVLRLAVRMQDNIKGIDALTLPLVTQRAIALLLRRVGIGNTGLSDCMAALGIRYDTEAGIQFVEKLYAFLRDIAFDESVNLAIEKGPFPAFNWATHNKCPFIQRLPEALRARIKKCGIRNIALLTQAPNGSMSILFRNCSSGAEPMFALKSSRNVRQETGDVVQHFLYHQAAQDAMDAGVSEELLDALFVGANDVDPEMRVRLQGIMQRYIDSAISITTNLSADATVEDVRRLYELAFENGCKGFTVYRDGSRTGVLNTVKKVIAHDKKERPKTTDIKIHKVKYKNQTYMVLVGLHEGKPIEVFGGLEDGLALPTKYQSATLTKKSRGHYSLVVQLSDDPEDVLKVNNVGARFPAEDIMTLTRLVSLSLRNGVPMNDIVDQLQKSAGGMFDAPAIFARVLKSYIEDEELAVMAAKEPCPQCGGAIEIKRESGCLVKQCIDTKCGWVDSKCN